MNRINYGEALRRRWWLLVVLGLVGLVGGLLVPTSHHKGPGSSRYDTSALVGSAPGSGASSKTLGRTNVSVTQIEYYAQTSAVITAAAQSVGIHLPLSKLESDVVVQLPKKAGKGTQPGVVKLTTVGSSPKLSADFTNAFANQLGNFLENLAKQAQQQQVTAAQDRVVAFQSEINAGGGPKHQPALVLKLDAAQSKVEQLAATTPTTGYTVVQQALPSQATNLAKGGIGLPASHVTYGAIGFLVGVLIGLVVIVAMELTDERIRSAARAAEAFGYPVAAEIPEPGGGRPTELSLARSTDPHAEAYRKLRMSVLLENLAGGPAADRAVRTATGPSKRQIFLVVSAADEPSRSAVVDNLAAASAEAGQRVIVVDALDPPPAGSTGSEIEDSVPDVDDIESRLEPSRLKNVAILKLSHMIGNSSQLLTRAPAVLDVARVVADVVIIEAPPLLAFHDGEALASVSDVVLVVGESGLTLSGHARRAGELLRRFDAPVLGVVFTGVKPNPADVRQADRTHAQSTRRSQLEATGVAAAGASQRPVD